MREWLEKNYKGSNTNYLEDIKKTEPMFQKIEYEQRDYTYTTSLLRQRQTKRIGSENCYMNSVQMRLQNNYNINFTNSQKVDINKK